MKSKEGAEALSTDNLIETMDEGLNTSKKEETPFKFMTFFRTKSNQESNENEEKLESKNSDNTDLTQTDSQNDVIQIEVFDTAVYPEQLNHSMLCTLHYMKYREAIRRYTGEFKNCPYAVCIGHIFMVICVILTTSLVSQHFDPTDPGTIRGNTHKSWYSLYIDNLNNLSLIIFIGSTVFSVVNLYICIHPNTFSKIVSLSKLTVKIYFILYPVLMIYNYSMNSSLQETSGQDNLRAVFNIRAYNIFGVFFYDTIFLTVYTILILFFNLIAFIYRFFYPHLLLTIINEDVKTFKVTGFEEMSLNAPNMGANNLNTGKIPAYKVTLTRFKKPNSIYYSFKCFIDFLHFKKRGSYDSFQYVGQLNSEFKPHGFGFWNSPNYHGELLMGFWESGITLSSLIKRHLAI